MKTIFLGSFGIIITIYSVLICLDIYSIQTHKNELEVRLTRAVENTLEQYYSGEDIKGAKAQLYSDVLSGENNKNISLEISSIDLEKGIVSAKVVEKVPLITGKRKEITFEKTAIMERKIVNHPKVTVTFFLDGNIYKEIQLTQGEICPMPKLPSENYIGWAENETSNIVAQIGAVQENQVYVAVEH